MPQGDPVVDRDTVEVRSLEGNFKYHHECYKEAWLKGMLGE